MEEVLKIVGALASLFAIYKLVVDVVLARSTRRRDEYSFTKDYISDLEGDSEHLYVLEKGFFALTGKIYSVPEVKLLLSQSSPSFSINLRSDCGGFIQFNDASFNYEWKGRYARKFVRKYAGKWFLFCYMLTASLAILPVYVKGVASLGDLQIASFSVSLFIIAISSLVQQSNLNNTKIFMEELVYPIPKKLSKQDTEIGAAA